MGIAYALFNKKNGKLYPQFVQTNEEVVIGEWTKAREDAEFIIKDNGRKYVKSKLGWLAFRPGKHLATIPLFNQIGVKDTDGKTLLRRPNTVICEVMYKDDVDWGEKCIERSKELNNGKIVSYDCCLDHLPYGGFYYFQTNTKAEVPWIICEEYMVVRELSEEEVAYICRMHGYEPQRLAV